MVEILHRWEDGCPVYFGPCLHRQNVNPHPIPCEVLECVEGKMRLSHGQFYEDGKPSFSIHYSEDTEPWSLEQFATEMEKLAELMPETDIRKLFAESHARDRRTIGLYRRFIFDVAEAIHGQGPPGYCDTELSPCIGHRIYQKAIKHGLIEQEYIKATREAIWEQTQQFDIE